MNIHWPILRNIHPVRALCPLLLLLSAGCGAKGTPPADYMVTIAPLKMILDPLVEGRKTVGCLIPPGASPHTFALRPSGAAQLANALAVFHVDETLDGWAARMAPGTAHAVLDLVPQASRLPYDFKHSHSHSHAHDEHAGSAEGDETNPHFWSDPAVIAAVVPGLVKILAERDPEGREIYETNGAAFIRELEELDEYLAAAMKELSPAALVAFHPSWSYYFERYGIVVADYVEPVPGKELTPQSILELRARLSDAERVIVLSEVQLPRRSAVALAEALGATIIELDPLGGRAPLESYGDLLRFNAARLQEAFR